MASYGKFIKYVMPDTVTTFRDRLCGAKLLWKVTVFLPSMFLKKSIGWLLESQTGCNSQMVMGQNPPLFIHPNVC
jgi:hypothetical protein